MDNWYGEFKLVYISTHESTGFSRMDMKKHAYPARARSALRARNKVDLLSLIVFPVQMGEVIRHTAKSSAIGLEPKNKNYP